MQQPQQQAPLQQQPDKLQNTRYNVLPSPVNPLQINNFYTHNQKFPGTTAAPITSQFKITTSSAKLRATTQKPVHRFSFTSATESPKPKSHQPPLAMFMKNTLSLLNKPTVNDVLSNLIFSRSIDVIDSVNGNASPEIFIGPHGLQIPDGYSKFELPYLSSLEQNRSERQITALPFFVAPLSYRAPKGFAKIPLPSPHVGSVVVNSPNSLDLRDFNDKTVFPDVKFQHQQTTTTKQPPSYFSFSTAAPERSRQTASTSRFRFGSDVTRSNYQPQNEQAEISSTTPSNLNNHFNVFKSQQPSYKPQAESIHRKPAIVNSDFDEQPFNFGNKYHTASNFATVAPPKQTNFEDYKIKDEGPSKFSLTNNPQPVNTTSFTFKNEEPFNNYFTQTPTNSYFNTPESIVSTTKLPDVTKYEVTNFDEPSRYSFTSPSPVPVSPTAASVSTTREDDSYRNDDIEKMKTYFREQEAFKVRQPIAVSTPASYYESSTAGTYQTEKGFNEYSK